MPTDFMRYDFTHAAGYVTRSVNLKLPINLQSFDLQASKDTNKPKEVLPYDCK